MCIVMGVFGLVLLGARIFYELKVFKWEDTGLSEEEIAKVAEKKERRKLTKKQIMAIVKLVVTVAVLTIIAIFISGLRIVAVEAVVLTVVWVNIFRAGKVDKINIGDSQEQLIKILGEPNKKADYTYEY